MRVSFPKYLTGSLKGRDYITNAQLHSGARVLICEDVTKFFPSVSTEKVFDIWALFRVLGSGCTAVDPADHEGWFTTPGRQHQQLLGKPCAGAMNLCFKRSWPPMALPIRATLTTCRCPVKENLTPQDIEHVIADVYGMLRKNALSAKRRSTRCSTARNG